MADDGELKRPASSDEIKIEFIRLFPKMLAFVLGAVLLALLWRHVDDFVDRTTKVGIGPISLEAETKLSKRPVTKDKSATEVLLLPEQRKEIADRYERIAEKLSQLKILWVDDNPIYNAYLVDFLEAAGVRVTVARSYDEAVRSLQERTYRIVISDFSRPTDQVEVEAKAKAKPGDFTGSGAILARIVAETTCGTRTILFSSAGSKMATPPFVYSQTNEAYTLLTQVANIVESGEYSC